MRDDIVKFLRIWDSQVFDDSVQSDDCAGTLTTHNNCYVIIGEIKNMDSAIILGTLSPERRTANNIYDSKGIAPTLCAGMGEGGRNTPLILTDNEDLHPVRLGNVYDEKYGQSFGGNVWDKEQIAPTLKTTSAASQQFIVETKEPIVMIAAMRGRDVENPTKTKKQRPEKPFEQQLEIQKDGVANTLTTFNKDNLVLEGVSTDGRVLDVAKTILSGYERTNMTGFNSDNAVLVGGIGEKKSNGGTQYFQQDRVYDANGIAMAHPAQLPEGSYKYMVEETKVHQQDLVQSEEGVSRTLVAGSHGNADTYTKTVVDYQIRKLTPKECFRLMGVRDEDYDKLTVSNSQRYKQAGNSIVVDVLMAIFENMFINECQSNTLF